MNTKYGFADYYKSEGFLRYRYPHTPNLVHICCIDIDTHTFTDEPTIRYKNNYLIYGGDDNDSFIKLEKGLLMGLQFAEYDNLKNRCFLVKFISSHPDSCCKSNAIITISGFIRNAMRISNAIMIIRDFIRTVIYKLSNT